MSMDLRRGDGRDILSRIATIESLTAAARELVGAEEPELAQLVLKEIAQHIEETP